MNDVITRRAVVSHFTAAIDSFTAAVRLALPPEMDKTHGADTAATIAAREPLVLATYKMMMDRGEIDGALQVAAAAVAETKIMDAALFEPCPSVDELTALWREVLRLRVGAAPDLESTRRSVEYMTNDDRRRQFYKFNHERASLLVREAA